MTAFINASKIRKICIIPMEQLGDVLMTTSICEALKKYLPHSEIHFIVYEPQHLLLDKHPYIDKTYILVKKKGWKYVVNRIKSFLYMLVSRFDVVIDYHNNKTTQIYCLLSMAKYRIGIKRTRFTFAYNYKPDRGKLRYAACEMFDLLTPLGIAEQPFKYYYHISDDSYQFTDTWLSIVGLKNKDFVIFSPGTRVETKKWRGDYYALLGDMVQAELGFPIILLYAQNELADCEFIYSQMTHKPIMATDYVKNLNRVAALLTKTKLLICNEGGLNHFSCATETTTIALFNHSYIPQKCSPAQVFSHHHHIYNPDYKSNDGSFGIKPEDVLMKIKEIL